LVIYIVLSMMHGQANIKVNKTTAKIPVIVLMWFSVPTFICQVSLKWTP